jgi:hypothetical protein
MGQVGIPRSRIREGHREAVGEALRQALGGVVSAALERSDAGDRLTKAAQLLKHGLHGTLRQVRAEAEENDVGNDPGADAAPPSCKTTTQRNRMNQWQGFRSSVGLNKTTILIECLPIPTYLADSSNLENHEDTISTWPQTMNNLLNMLATANYPCR